ncbi:unnamed protein product [Prorocentrum cordatum]|uniref:Uncharacterized protein n=1 Tax=Prorocentrum cordatum TaxID=2364126 RepID=A0ABN9VUA0_9DINO|nr:unnamed protein product [Polarella glacialis]
MHRVVDRAEGRRQTTRRRSPEHEARAQAHTQPAPAGPAERRAPERRHLAHAEVPRRTRPPATTALAVCPQHQELPRTSGVGAHVRNPLHAPPRAAARAGCSNRGRQGRNRQALKDIWAQCNL